MDEEKMRRQMEFLLEWQAQFAAKLGQTEENIARLNKAAEQQGENVQRLGENVELLLGVVERVVDTVARLTEVTAKRFEAVERRADETDRKLGALVDAQIQTEGTVRRIGEKVGDLAAMMERHVADGHGGRAQPEG
ncbi:MAG TPA: hypothetical protein VN282_15460 [Pyrinomonadaceae bacterium]|nr:hypothetical protein [Pyrinomonadaceae bacterium]